jgi:tRNA-uridine aminocarboxypropyltransferase
MSCATCGKSSPLCICDSIAPLESRHEVLILQHPQEQDRDLGTARIAALQLTKARLVVGLSWPSLGAALGRSADARRWATLHPWSEAPDETVALQGAADAGEALAALDGIILLDGSWSQAKALWWRNPWLLKTRRIALHPTAPSLYGELRREPRRAALSTIEAAAFLLSRLEDDPSLERRVLAPFEALLQRYRAVAGRPPAHPPDRRRLARRHRFR